MVAKNLAYTIFCMILINKKDPGSFSTLKLVEMEISQPLRQPRASLRLYKGLRGHARQRHPTALIIKGCRADAFACRVSGILFMAGSDMRPAAV